MTRTKGSHTVTKELFDKVRYMQTNHEPVDRITELLHVSPDTQRKIARERTWGEHQRIRNAKALQRRTKVTVERIQAAKAIMTPTEEPTVTVSPSKRIEIIEATVDANRYNALEVKINSLARKQRDLERRLARVEAMTVNAPVLPYDGHVFDLDDVPTPKFRINALTRLWRRK